MFGQSETLPDEAGDLLNFWGNQAEQLFQSDRALTSEQGLTDNMKYTITENLKRRMPVLVRTAADTYILFAYNEMEQLYSVFGTDGTRNDEWSADDYNGIVSIIDTGKYFNILRSGMYLSDEQSGSANTKTVTISLPDGYTDDRCNG